MSRAQRYIGEAREFVRDYTAGLNVRDLRILVQRDSRQVARVAALIDWLRCGLNTLL